MFLLCSLDLPRFVESNEWVSVRVAGSAPSPRLGAAACVADGRVYLHGGSDVEKRPLADMYTLELRT